MLRRAACGLLLVVLGVPAGALAATAEILRPQAFRPYIEAFNRDDHELHPSGISNAAAWDFLSANIPRFECPDPDLERTYYFRWWTFRKHIQRTSEGHVITEFLPRMPWGGKYNEINAAAPLQITEGRWLHDRRILDDYGHYWFRGSGRARNRLYSCWAAHALFGRFLVTGDATQVSDLLPDLIAYFEAWARTNRDANGLFWQTDVADAMEESLGGHGYRATINSQMFGDANAIAAIAAQAGHAGIAQRFRAEAARLQQLVQSTLWDEAAQFYKVAPRLDALPLRSVGVLRWRVNRNPTIGAAAGVSASHHGEGDTLAAVNARDEPRVSRAAAEPRLMFAGRRGTTEWVQYDFAQPIEADSVQVFWYQDDGDCRLPRTWRVLYRDGETWRPVRHLRFYLPQADRFNHVPFAPVRTTGLRLEVTGQGVPGWVPGDPVPLADVRELHGYTPWYFDLPAADQAVAWKQLMDPQGFFAPFGPTTAEQRHPGFKLDEEGHPCQWNGPSWPFATSITLTALANLLNGPAQSFVTKGDYLVVLRNYARSHQLRRDDGRVVPWIDENLHPYTGEWLTRAKLLRRGTKPSERGKDYNHSTFCDLIITGLVGLRPRADDTVEVHPLVPSETWDYFCLDGVPYHGRQLTILYDRTGVRYGRGAGLRVLADGQEIAAAPKLQRLAGRLPPPPSRK